MIYTISDIFNDFNKLETILHTKYHQNPMVLYKKSFKGVNIGLPSDLLMTETIRF